MLKHLHATASSFLVVVAAMTTTTSAGIGIKLSSFGVPDEAIALISNKRVRSEHLWAKLVKLHIRAGTG
jgi:hypothetical protein